MGLSVLIVRCRRFPNLSSDLTRNILVVSQVFNLDCRFDQRLITGNRILDHIVTHRKLVCVDVDLPMQETIRSVDPGIALADPDVFRNSAVSRNAVARLLIAKLCPVS